MPAAFPPVVCRLCVQQHLYLSIDEYLSLRSACPVTWALGPLPPHERAAARRARARVQDCGSRTNPQGTVSQKHRICQCLTKPEVKARANDFGVLICILLPRPPFFCRGKAPTVKQYRGFKARRPLALAGHFSQGNPHFKSSLKTKLQFIYKHVWTRQAPQLFQLKTKSS